MDRDRTTRWLLACGVVGPLAGAFPTDTSLGYPAGTPAGPLTTPSWHANVHFIGALLFFGGLTGAALVLARRFAIIGLRGWAICSTLTAIAVLVLFIVEFPLTDLTGLVQRFSIVAGLAWMLLVAVQLLRERPVEQSAPATSG